MKLALVWARVCGGPAGCIRDGNGSPPRTEKEPPRREEGKPDLTSRMKHCPPNATLASLPKDLVLPWSTTGVHPHRQVGVYISKSAVLVEDEKVAAVRNGEVNSSTERRAQSAGVISPLLSALRKHAARLKKTEERTGGKVRFEGALELLCNKTVPFRLVSQVLLTAGEAEFGKFSLLTNMHKSGRGRTCTTTASLVFKIPRVGGHHVSLKPCSFICGPACQEAEAARRRARLMFQASKLSPPQGPAVPRKTPKSKDKRGPRPHLSVAVSISREGFTVTKSGKVVDGPAGYNVSIPCKGTTGGRCNWKTTATRLRDNYDYEKLHKMLARVKRKLPKERCVSVTADSLVPLQVVVRTLDAARGMPKVECSGERDCLFDHAVVIPVEP